MKQSTPNKSEPTRATAARCVCLIGGGPIGDEDWPLIRSLTSKFIAVDGGANNLPTGLIPELIIGDLDSVVDEDHWRSKTKVIEVADQDSTDLEKALSYCQHFPSDTIFIGLGFIGGRFDQTLTVLHACCCFSHLRLMFLSDTDLIMQLPHGETELRLPRAARVSLYPLTSCEFGPSVGLKYPLTGLNMEQGRCIGTSNEVLGEFVKIDLIDGECLLMVDRRNARAVWQGLGIV